MKENLVERVFLFSGLLFYTIIFFTFGENNLIRSQSSFLLGGAFAAINLKSWGLIYSFFKMDLGAKKKKLVSLVTFLAIKLFFVIVLLVFFFYGMREEILSLVLGFIGYLFSGSFGLIFYLLIFKRGQFFKS